MRKYFLVACGWLMAGIALGQTLPNSINPPAGAQTPIKEAMGPSVMSGSAAVKSPRPDFWIEGGYVMWWFKSATPDFPLITTGDPANDATAGSLGSSSTRIVHDGSSLYPGLVSGMRINAGVWIDNENTLGLEVGAFFTQQRRRTVSAGSDATGAPPLYVPIFLSDFASEGKFIISDPTVPFVGNAIFSSTTELWGAEANIYNNMISERDMTMDFLVGFRYLGLRESISLQAAAGNDPANDIQSSLNDRFATRNDFYGGQFGARMEWRRNRLSLGLLGKIALGYTHLASDVSGSTTLAGTGVAPVLGIAPGTYPGGIFTQPSNIGQQSENKFTIVPQVQVKMGWDITTSLKALVSYDFLYWNNVVRPGDQMDRNVNTAQSPLSPNFSPTGSSAPPTRMFNRSEFWAHGVTLGLEFRY